MRVAINGFGRIGRLVFRTLAQRHPELEVVAINDLTDATTNAHLLKYDSNYGGYPGTVEVDGDHMTVDGASIRVLAQRDWDELPWGDLDVQVALECTGVGTGRAMAGKHLAAGAKKVLISAPSGDADAMIVLGVNDDIYDAAKHHVVSNASCTTNGLAPPVSVVHNEFGIVKGQMTTVHSYTGGQAILDTQKKDLRDARSGAMNIVPASTGAARAIGMVIPELHGRLDGAAYRVPTPTVSIVEFVVLLEKSATADEINARLRAAAEGRLAGILDVSDEPLVSLDLKGNEHSSIVDAGSTMVVDGNLAKIAAWYDNEWGYASRLADMAAFLSKN
ncbi:MAG: type I glyceraldehyde-3-phosphate dehydrogenase [Chloroflexota bacterium]|jgi:glyceraldehyde 3-phosphate dehydrogenase|nr:type I glyceraldehyde-3-phosphate dehydrogenase [Chloroflexota bacterium]